MTLQEIYNKFAEFVDQNGDIFSCYDEEKEEVYDAFHDMVDEIMNDHQTYFIRGFEKDGTFRVSLLLRDILQYLYSQNETVSDFYIDCFGDDLFIALIETNPKED